MTTKRRNVRGNPNPTSKKKPKIATETKTEEIITSDKTTFEGLGVVDTICSACHSLKFKTPTQIQQEAIPHALQGRDVIGLAETGSGKTAAFAIPILQFLIKEPQAFYGLVLAPTRELAYQISEQFGAIGCNIGVKVVTIVGGIDIMEQALMLARKPHVIVATPGRLIDHLENTKGFSIKNLKCLVFDEADRLLDMDFEKELNTLLQLVPRNRHTYLYSATMTEKVQKLQRASLTDPVMVKVSEKYQTVKTLVQEYLFIPAKYKDVYLASILNDLTGKTFMIFVERVLETQRVAIILRNLGFSAVPLNGKMSQPKRLGALNKFKAGERSILVATDVASRGLDIPSVDVVINYDTATQSKDYIHRVGRTARAGRSGRAISLVTQYDVELFQRIEQLIGQKMKQYETEEAAVMLFSERVAEARRIASMDLKEEQEKRTFNGSKNRTFAHKKRSFTGSKKRNGKQKHKR